MKEKEEKLYVGIEDPIAIRRALLESSKSLIKILQENENTRQRREQKHRLLAELKNTAKELTRLLAQLKSELPRVKMSSLPKKMKPRMLPTQKPAPKPATAQTVKKPATATRPMHLSEAQKLEKELKDIEDKLNKLG